MEDRSESSILGIKERNMETITLYRPVNNRELLLIEESGNIRFPPRLDFQPIFYPVCTLQYARDVSLWNILTYGVGYIVEFKVEKSYLDNFEVHNVGDTYHNEYWIPSEELEEFNSHIVGTITVIEEIKE